MRVRMERRFGKDFSSVRVHQGTEAASLASQAFAMGEHLYFEPGRYRPDTPTGERLLGHELTHVVQQREMGLAARTPSRIAVLDDRGLERQAETSADRVSRGENAPVEAARSAAVGSVPAGAGVAQRAAWTVQKDKGFLSAEANDAPEGVPATRVAAKLIWLDQGQSLKNYYLGGSRPAEAGDPVGWKEYVKGRNFPDMLPYSGGLPNHETNWKRLHLLNDNLGGPGNKRYNLTPGRTVTNSAMLHGVEKGAKDEVEKGGAIRYAATAEYNHANGPKYSQAPGQHFELRAAGTAGGTDVFSWFPSKLRVVWSRMVVGNGAGAVANPVDHQNYIDDPNGIELEWEENISPPINLQNPAVVVLHDNDAIPQPDQTFLQEELGINQETVEDMDTVMQNGDVQTLDDLRSGIGFLRTGNIANAERFINIA
ncbi:MAG: DUF4157 domain-containing protein [Thermoanaerobaculia bacterium]|nr:DUF4157 domain-containing protein [Thermoanaerobaculia bacterium]